MGLLIGISVVKFEKDQCKEFTPMKFCGMIFKVRNKNIHNNGSPALCKHSVVYIKQSHIWGISWKNIYVYTPIHRHIHRIFTSPLAPKPADNKIKWERITYQQEKVTHRELTKNVVI